MPAFTLIDHDRNIWLEKFEHHVGCVSIGKHTLHGGLSDGVDLIEVNNGALSFSVLPTRGLGLWRGDYHGIRLGWDAPIRGPVHPKFVNQSDRGGLGWLTGFDEWLCRCGLNWNGPPGDDNGRPLTLHGRIANSPAHFVEVEIDGDQIRVRGEVEEAGLFYSRLRLSVTYTTQLNSNRVEIRDEVTNLGGSPAEMQLLYHCNFGPPLLGPTSRVSVPVSQLWPMTEWAASDIDHWTEYGPPTAGFEEQAYCMTPIPNEHGESLAILHNNDAGVLLRWPVAALPYFTVWKNTAAIEDGYVTGLEPATNFPRFKALERQAGRVVNLPPGGKWQASWSVEVTDQSSEIQRWQSEIAQLQSTNKQLVHRSPLVN